MCTATVDPGPAETRDIFIRASKYEAGPSSSADVLARPEPDARFNKCLNLGDSDSKAYGHFLHEVGHALGIGGSGSGHPGDPETAHFVDSVMDYNFTQPDCSPYPLDVMAIYALYQTVVP